MKHLLSYCVFFAVLLNCGSGKEFTEDQNQAYLNLQELVASKSFKIVSTNAMPIASASYSKVANSNILGPGNSASYIDISSNANRLIVKGDSISGYLPFFGDQYSGGGYGSSNSGIEFKDIPENYHVTLEEKKQAVNIRFKIADKNRRMERYDIAITLFPNNKSTIRIQPTTRSAIEYVGRISPREEDDKI